MNTATAPVVPVAADPDDCAITAARLMAFCPLLTLGEAQIHAEALEAARPLGELTTHNRVRHFLAQCAEETRGFKVLRENMNYRDAAHLDQVFKAVTDVAHARKLIAQGPMAIANWVYANRCGNGPPESGDGWTFRGGGYLEITFRDNYRHVGGIAGLPLEEHPEMLSQPGPAAKAAASYWKWCKINAAADCDAIRAVTALINPAQAGLDARTAWLGRIRPIYP